MASDAEVDLVVNASGTLRDVERDLQRIVNRAENTAPDVTLAAVLDQTTSLRAMETRLEALVQRAEAGASDIDLDATLNQLSSLRQVRRQLDTLVNRAEQRSEPINLNATLNTTRSLRNVRSQLDDIASTARRSLTDVDDATQDTDRNFEVLTRSVSQLSGTLARLGPTAIPPILGIGAALVSVLPAAATLTTGILAVQLATQTLRLGFLNVGEAIETAFDPEAKPEDLKKALDKLSPSAREFVEELRGMRQEFKELQLGVQERLFKGLADQLDPLAKRVLPDIQGALNDTADSFNDMGLDISATALKLDKEGVLGQALDGATQGLENLETVPGDVTESFLRLAAAASPAFDRITAAISRVFDTANEKIRELDESGELQRFIDTAVTNLGKLFEIGQNVFDILSNIFGSLGIDSGAFLDNLIQITDNFVKITENPEFLDFMQRVGDLFGDASTEAGGFSDTLVDISPTIFDFAGSSLSTLTLGLDGVKLAFKGLSQVMEGDYVGALKTTEEITGEVSDAVPDFIERMAVRFRDAIVRLVTNVVVEFQRLKIRGASEIQQLAERITAGFNNLPILIRQAFGRASLILFQTGRDIINGLISGIQSQVGALIDRAQSIASTVADTIRGALDINSPSLVMADIGDNVVQGLIVGMRRTMPDLRREVQGLALAIPTGARGVPTRAGQLNAPQPVVNVYVGNQQLTSFVDFRVALADRRNAQIFAQGVRR